MKTISDCICEMDEKTVIRAQKHLDSKCVKSIKFMRTEGDSGEFEAFIHERGQVLMPSIEVDNALNVLDIHCQCGEEYKHCMHEAALLLAAQYMIETNCPDYHMALKLRIAKTVESLFFPD